MVTKIILGNSPKGRRFRLVILGVIVTASLLLVSQYSLLARAASAYDNYGIEGSFDRARDKFLPVNSHVAWELETPEDYGLETSKLNALADDLANKQTVGFLVLKDGHLVLERYAEGRNADMRHSTAALAKPVVGSLVLMAAMDQGVIDLADPAWKYIPDWENDPIKSQITIGHLGSHSSGFDNVSFVDDLPPGWKLTYHENDDLRFEMAQTVVPLLFDPGTDTKYSGVAYYALAYAVASSLQDAPVSDVRKLLATQIMEPLQIPRGAWDISYGRRYRLDGMNLYAIGSGANYSPRAIARIGQFVLNRGEWNGQQLVKAATMDSVLEYSGLEGGSDRGIYSIGWRANSDGSIPSLPRDAIWGIGRGDQVLLVVPSLDLVMVRMGRQLLTEDQSDADYDAYLNEQLFGPLMQALN